MISVKLVRAEFQDMIQYLRLNTQYQEQVPLVNQSTNMLVMMDYLETWSTVRLLTWSQRRPDKEYRLSLKPVVARVLHQEMQQSILMPNQQIFLNRLDQAIVNYNYSYALVRV